MIANHPALHRLLPWLLSALVLICGAASTFYLFDQTRHQELTNLKTLLDAEARQATMNIAHRLDTYEAVMRGIQGFFHGSEDVRYDEFLQYTATLRATESLAGVQGIAYVSVVDRDDLARHENELAAQLPLPYRVSPRSSAERAAPIQFIAPLTGENRRALGFDIYSNPEARASADLARDSGKAVATPPLSLIQDADRKGARSIVMYLPVYRTGTTPQAVAERRRAHLGWVDVPIRMTDFMASVREEISPHLDFEIRDTNGQPGEDLLFRANTPARENRVLADIQQAQTSIDVGTRTWNLTFRATPEFQARAGLPSRSNLIGIAGGLLTVALGLLIWLITRNWDASERRAVRMTRLYHALSEVNQAIVRMETDEELFPLVCRMAVDYGGMKMAWVGQFSENMQRMTLVAKYGRGSESLKPHRVVPVDAGTPEGQTPGPQAARSNEPVIVNDYLQDKRTAVWRDRAKKHGWRSSAAFPISRQGKPFAVLTVFHRRRGAFDGEVIDLLTEMAKDISFALDNFDRERERIRFERELADSKNRLSTILENVGACIYMKDLEGRYLFANQKVLDLWGIEKEEDVIGATDEKFFDAVTARQVRENDRWVLEGGEIVEKEEVDTVKSTGVTRTFWSVKIPMRRTDGSIYALCGISTDISESRAREEKIRYLSNYDVLTGLPNRELLRERTRLAVTYADTRGVGAALLCIDLDRFKFINESLSHSVGDLVLKRIAERLTAELHMDATLCRMSGDEFFLLLPGVNREQAADIAAVLLGKIAEPLDTGKQTLTVTASIGIALFPEHGRDFDRLIQSADAALAEAKQQGRETIRVFSKNLGTRVTEALQLEIDLRRAVENDQLLIYYQPQLEIASGRIIGVEALVRWQHPVRGLIPPIRFIPLAEETGLIVEIGNWVMERALSQLSDWTAEGLPPLSMAVNLSVVQLYRSNFSDTVAALVREHRPGNGVLELEITERIAMEHSTHTISTLGALQRLGISLSIDDFGTGFSSLNYLKRYPIQKLKIDKSFVDGLGDDAEDRAIVIAIIGLARGLGFKTIAEGVETREQLDFLRANGCDAFQGYYFSRPVPPDQLTEMLKNQALNGDNSGNFP